MATIKSLVQAIEGRQCDLLRELLSSNINPNAVDRDSGESLLSIAIETGDRAIVEELLKAGADPNSKRTLTPPVMIAAGKGNMELLDLLLSAGANVDMRDEGGGTALMDAAVKGYVDIVKRLLQAGANPKAKDHGNACAIVYAAEKGHEEILVLLSSISTPAMRERAQLELRLLKEPPHERLDELFNLIRPNKPGGKPGTLDEIKKLIEEGVPYDGIGANGVTPLMYAAHRGRLDVLDYLIQLGADVNRKTVYGEYPLSYSVMGGASKAYNYLLPLTNKKLHKRAEHNRWVAIQNGTWKEE